MQRPPACPRDILQLFERTRADSARREIDNSQKAGVVVRVFQNSQVSQRVFDLGPLEKAQTAINLVGHGGIEQGGFNHPALGVGAVQDSHFAARNAFPDQLPDFIHHPLRLSKIAG